MAADAGAAGLLAAPPLGGGGARVQLARARRRRCGGGGGGGGAARAAAALPVQAAVLVAALVCLGVFSWGGGAPGGGRRLAAAPAAAPRVDGGAGVGGGGGGGADARVAASAVRAVLLPGAAARQAPAGDVAVVEPTDSYGGLCTPVDGFLDRPSALGLYVPGVMFLFLGLAIVTDDYFVASLDRICEQLRLSDDVAGATFLAAGSSAPELFTSLISVFVTKDEVGVGTIVGSAVFNVLVIIGSAAALAGSVLHLDWRPLMRDSFFYFVFIALLFMSLVVTSRSNATWYEGLILVLAYGGYIAFMKWGNKPYMRAAKKWSDGRRARAAARAGTPNGDVEAAPAGAAAPPPAGTGASSTTGGSDSADTVGETFPDGPPTGTTASAPSLAADVAAWRERLTEMDLLDAKGMPTFGPGSPLSARTYLRRAGLAAIAMKRMEAASSPTGSHDGPESRTGRLPEVSFTGGGGGGGGGDAESDADRTATATSVDGELEEEDEERTLLGVARPTSAVGWAIFPGVFLWSWAFKVTILNCAKDRWAKWWPVTFLASVGWIGGISYAMVEAARHAGCIVNIPASVLGLTVLAAGTSVPDALASITVAKQGRGDMAVSNALGSNVFDIGLGLGLPWLLGHLILKEPQSIPTTPVSSIVVPVVILCVVLFALLGVLAASRWRLGKGVGILLIFGYGLFVAYALIAALVFKWV